MKFINGTNRNQLPLFVSSIDEAILILALLSILSKIDQNLLRQYLKVLALHFGVPIPVFNAFYGLFYFKNEECFFPERILIVV
ncbi:hypothetical protein [Flavobacterium sp. GT3P67]|uniref:hypothetical protein n=1 Tax=Flavobacterium sp. GT3P67 TaxID=2541722 RepID=UPI001050A861|nr:hypothetical protein [Flavobacterium sp. GT3P67]TDE48412.1 hypothetical protein E0H99_16880 [Flavobacterium sp. GT3P67]